MPGMEGNKGSLKMCQSRSSCSCVPSANPRPSNLILLFGFDVSLSLSLSQVCSGPDRTITASQEPRRPTVSASQLVTCGVAQPAVPWFGGDDNPKQKATVPRKLNNRFFLGTETSVRQRPTSRGCDAFLTTHSAL